jgi:hypothetical protein
LKINPKPQIRLDAVDDGWRMVTAAVVMRVHRYSSSNRMRIWIPIGLIAVSFLVYACATLIVSREQQNDFIPERSSIDAAASNVAYGAQLGKVYSGVLAQLLNFKVPLDKTLAQAAHQEVPQGSSLGSTVDGNGIGYIVVASLSLRFLGLHTLPIVLAMLMLMGVLAIVFCWRFRDRRAIVVILYFSSLTIMLFTQPVRQPAYSLNMTIGGIRYFRWLRYCRHSICCWSASIRDDRVPERLDLHLARWQCKLWSLYWPSLYASRHHAHTS